MNSKVSIALKTSLLAAVLALGTGCATKGPALADVKAMAEQAQQAAAEAKAAANAANSTANEALNAANKAQSCCDANSEKLNRMFEKSMRK